MLSRGKSLGVLQVKCRSTYNKALKFCNLVDTYNPDVIIGMESWLRSSELTLHTSEEIDLPIVVVFLSVLKISLPVRSCE
jgi:hypothetical protein